MLKDKDLKELRPTYKYMNGANITLPSIQNALADTSNRYQIPIAFYRDQIKTGGLLNSKVNDCLVLYHPAHRKDYCKVAISISRQGTMAFVRTDEFGTSKNMSRLSARSAAVGSLKTGWRNANRAGNYSPGMSLVGGLTGAAIGGLRAIGGSRAKQEEENLYYGALLSILDEVIH